MGRGQGSAGRGGKSGGGGGSGGGGEPDATGSPQASAAAISRVERDIQAARNRFSNSPEWTAEGKVARRAAQADIERLTAQRERLITGGRAFNARERNNDFIRKQIAYQEKALSGFNKRVKSSTRPETIADYRRAARNAEADIASLRARLQ